MDSAALTSLSPLFNDIDRWVELAPLLPVLISLELVLSADNAVALASIASQLDNKKLQSNALNLGISLALIMRIFLILTAQTLLKFTILQIIAGIYLITLCFIKIKEKYLTNEDKNIQNDTIKLNKISFISIVALLAITDLAFSIDSVAAAVAISDQFLLVITGAIIGVIALRFTSGLFIRWLAIYVNLETAGYIAIALVGFKLLLKVALPNLILSETLVLSSVILLFIWGFSKKIEVNKS